MHFRLYEYTQFLLQKLISAIGYNLFYVYAQILSSKNNIYPINSFPDH